MTILFLYILGRSPNADNIECMVPYQASDTVTFFGPCLKPLRERLRNHYLKASDDYLLPGNEKAFVVGVNGGNRQHNRKIVWAGRITRVMTFETAYNDLTTSEFQEMRSHPLSPLHVRPLSGDGDSFVGYERISGLHKDCWASDVTKHQGLQTRLDGKRLYLVPGANRSKVFTLDCCFLCDNIFFARGVGIRITEEMLDLLQKAQPDKTIDTYAIFGYCANRSVNGRRGHYLEMCGELAESFIGLIRASTPPSPHPPASPSRLKPCC